MQDKEIFNIYKINSLRSITRYSIVRYGGKYKIKKKMKENFPSSSDCIEKVLELQDNGYISIDVLLSALSKKEFNKLFINDSDMQKNQKGLNLSLKKRN